TALRTSPLRRACSRRPEVVLPRLPARDRKPLHRRTPGRAPGRAGTRRGRRPRRARGAGSCSCTVERRPEPRRCTPFVGAVPVTPRSPARSLAPMPLPRLDVDPDIRRARTLPADVYRDPRWYAAQVERVFTRTWHVAADVERLFEQANTAPCTLLEGCLD